jgi:hypothetical protein
MAFLAPLQVDFISGFVRLQMCQNVAVGVVVFKSFYEVDAVSK